MAPRSAKAVADVVEWRCARARLIVKAPLPAKEPLRGDADSQAVPYKKAQERAEQLAAGRRAAVK